MIEWIEIKDEFLSQLNLDVYQRFADGVFNSYVMKAKEGYVFYDPNEIHWEQDSPDSEPIQVYHYHLIRIFPKNYNWSDATFLVLPKTEVDSQYIF